MPTFPVDDHDGDLAAAFGGLGANDDASEAPRPPPTRAARAWEMIHDRKMTMRETAKALGVGTYDVGELLTAHKRVLDAAALEAAKGNFMAPDDSIQRAVADAEHRRRMIEKARRLIVEGVEAVDIAERLGIEARLINALPEARSRAAARLAAAAEERRAAKAEKKKAPKDCMPPIVLSARAAEADEARRRAEDEWRQAMSDIARWRREALIGGTTGAIRTLRASSSFVRRALSGR